MEKEQRLTRSWHTNLLLGFLAIWSVWSFVGIVMALANAPKGMGLGWLDYYVFLSVPILIGFGAYLLFVQSRLRPLPFVLLPFMYIWSAIRIYPRELSPEHWQVNAAYFAQFPLVYRVCAAFFLACALYCFLLNKRQRSERAAS